MDFNTDPGIEPTYRQDSPNLANQIVLVVIAICILGAIILTYVASHQQKNSVLTPTEVKKNPAPSLPVQSPVKAGQDKG